MTRALATTVAIVLVLAATGGAAASSKAFPTRPRRGPTAAELLGGVVRALHANHRLAVQVLWTNRIPTTAQRSTRGPALAALRASGKDRQGKELRVRMLHDTYRILSIRLNKTHTNATALVQSNQELLPSHLDGKPLGRPLELNERAQILLRRLGSSSRFVVWKVGLTR